MQSRDRSAVNGLQSCSSGIQNLPSSVRDASRIDKAIEEYVNCSAPLHGQSVCQSETVVLLKDMDQAASARFDRKGPVKC